MQPLAGVEAKGEGDSPCRPFSLSSEDARRRSSSRQCLRSACRKEFHYSGISKILGTRHLNIREKNPMNGFLSNIGKRRLHVGEKKPINVGYGEP